MYLDVYISDLEGFDWDDTSEWNTGHTPKKISVLFPSARNLYYELIEKIKSGELQGKQTDWGASVSKVNKNNIKMIIEKYYEENPLGKFQHLQQELTELNKQVEALDDKKMYGLVCSEL